MTSALHGGFKTEKEATEGARELYVKGWKVEAIEESPTGGWGIRTSGYSEPEVIRRFKGTPTEQARQIREYSKKEAEKYEVVKEAPKPRIMTVTAEFVRPWGGGARPPEETIAFTPEIKRVSPGPPGHEPSIQTIQKTEKVISGKTETEIAGEKLEKLWGEKYAPVERAKVEASEPEKFLLGTGESLGFTHARIMGVEPELREKTIQFILKHPKEVTKAVASSLIIWPWRVGESIGTHIKRGEYSLALGEIAGISAILIGGAKIVSGAKKLVPKIKAHVPTKTQVKVDLSHIHGVSRTVSGKQASVSTGRFVTKTRIKGEVISKSIITKKGAVSDVIINIPEQRIRGVKIHQKTDMVFVKSKTQGKITTSRYSDIALDILRARGYKKVQVSVYREPYLIRKSITGTTKAKGTKISRDLLGKRQGGSRIRELWKIKRGPADVRGFKGFTVEPSIPTHKTIRIKIQKVDWVDVHTQIPRGTRISPTRPGPGKPRTGVTPSTKTGPPSLPKTTKVTVSGTPKKIAKIIPDYRPPSYYEGIRIEQLSAPIPIVTISQISRIPRIVRPTQQLTELRTVHPAPRITKVVTGQKLEEEQTPRRTLEIKPIQRISRREDTDTILLQAIAQTPKLVQRVSVAPPPPPPPIVSPPPPLPPGILYVPPIGIYTRRGDLRVLSYETKWVRNPVPDIKHIV